MYVTNPHFYGVIQMSKQKKKNIPVPVPEKSSQEYLFPSASMSDMTGLIPASADDNFRRDAYSDILPYMADADKINHPKKQN